MGIYGILAIIAAVLIGMTALAFKLMGKARERAEKAERERDDALRGERLAKGNTDSLMKYMADAKELKEVHDDDYVEYKAAESSEDKHRKINNMLDRLNSGKSRKL